MTDRADTQPMIYRHRLATRLWHWVNVVVLFVLLMSGLMIFNAHPRLYWGSYGANFDQAWLEIGATPDAGVLKIGSLTVPTTGVLGRWTDPNGNVQTRAFPHWATIPSSYDLAGARRWHLAFAWIFAWGLLAFMVASLVNRHIARDLKLGRRELSPRRLWHDAKDHARLRFPTGQEARRYNPIQVISYVGVIFVALPLLIATGLTMSPGMNAAAPWLLDLLGGRQSARSLHFIAAVAVVLFTIVHILLVLLSGPLNQLHGMVTGWWRLPAERQP